MVTEIYLYVNYGSIDTKAKGASMPIFKDIDSIFFTQCNFFHSSLAILAGHWSVQLPVSPVCAVVGSSVVLPCSFNFPQSSLESESNKVGGLPAQVK